MMDLGERLERAWRSFRGSLLFFPTLMSIAALALFVATSVADGNNALERTLEEWSGTPLGFLVFAGGPEAAISLLGSIVSTWATIVGVVYSVVLVTLQLSATKYSAQVIPVFERDKLNQIVLGTFTATFVYSLLVLKTVRVADDDVYVPLLSTNVAVLLALVSLFMLIALIGNLTAYIRPTRFVDDYARSGIRALPRTPGPADVKGFRPLKGDEVRRFLEGADNHQEAENCSVRSEMDGYVTALSWPRVRTALLAAPENVRRVVVRTPVAGHVGEEEALLTCQNVSSIDAKTERRLRRAFALAASAHGGDPKQVLDTLADIGVTALSGGATDVGVAKSAMQGILRVTAASLERVDEGHRMWAVEAQGRQIVLTLEQERFYESGFLAARRVLHKAKIEEYWDVAETFTRHSAPVYRNAANSTDGRVWDDLLEWFRPIAQGLFEYDDAQARIRMVRHLRSATAELREDDHDEKALDIEFILLQAARDAGVADEVRTAIAGHGDE